MSKEQPLKQEKFLCKIYYHNILGGDLTDTIDTLIDLKAKFHNHEKLNLKYDGDAHFILYGTEK